jgi:hypothetical protein
MKLAKDKVYQALVVFDQQPNVRSLAATESI